MNISEFAYCGLTCHNCPIYLATIEIDKEKQAKKRIQIAKTIREHYGVHTKPEDITDCDGCKANTGRQFSGCLECKIRNCAQSKDYLTCAHCPEYPSNELEKFFFNEPQTKYNLEMIKSRLKIIS